MTLPATMRPLGSESEPFTLSEIAAHRDSTDPMMASGLYVADTIMALRAALKACRAVAAAIEHDDAGEMRVAASKLEAESMRAATLAAVVGNAAERARTKRAKLVHRERNVA